MVEREVEALSVGGSIPSRPTKKINYPYISDALKKFKEQVEIKLDLAYTCIYHGAYFAERYLLVGSRS